MCNKTHNRFTDDFNNSVGGNYPHLSTLQILKLYGTREDITKYKKNKTNVKFNK